MKSVRRRRLVRTRRLFLEPLEKRYTLNADVDASGLVVPLDALLIANALNAKGEFASSSRLDVTGDGFITAADFDAVAEVLDDGAADGSGGGGDELVLLAEDGEGEGSGSGSGGGSASIAIAPLDANKSEGNDGAFPQFTFRVTLTGNVPGGFSVTWSTMDITTGSERENDIHLDFHAWENQTLNFSGTNGEYRDISISINGDTVVEIDELFQVNLGDVTNVPVGFTVTKTTDSALGTIQNDDSAVVTIDDLGTANETGAPNYHDFHVDSSAFVEAYGVNTLTVNYSIVDVDTTSADYSDTRGGTIEFSTQFYGGYYYWHEPLRINIVDENVAELQYEDYFVSLDSIASGGMPVTISETEYIGDATIESNDIALFNIDTDFDYPSLGDVAQVPEDEPWLSITITWSNPIDTTVQVRLVTLASSNTPAAVPDVDYDHYVPPEGNYQVAAMSTEMNGYKIIYLDDYDDAVADGDKWFRIELVILDSNGRMVAIGGDAQRDVKIIDNES